MEVKDIIVADDGYKMRKFYLTAKGIFEGVSSLLEESKEELSQISEGFPVNETDILRLEEKIKRLEIEKELIDFIDKRTFDC